MTVESVWPSDRLRDLNRLADADLKVRLVLNSAPVGPIGAKLEAASHLIAEAAALIERGE